MWTIRKPCKIIWLILVGIWLTPTQKSAAADAPAWYPDHGTFQVAGYHGAVALGLRYELNHLIATELSFGYTPEQLGGRHIRQINWNNKLDYLALFQGDGAKFGSYVGLGMLYGMSRQLFLFLPSKYPSNYYQPTALRYTLSIGIDYRCTEAIDIYSEYAYHDSELTSYYNSPYSGGWWDLGSLGLGMRIKLPYQG